MLIDLVVIALILMGARWGWRKGLVRMITGWLAWLLVPYLALRFTGSLVDFLNRSYGVTGETAAFLVQHQLFLQIGSFVQFLIMPLDYLLTLLLGRGLGLAAADAAPAVLAESLARIFVYLLCLIALFFLAKIGLSLLASLITRGLDHTLIGAANHLSGGALGAAATFALTAILLIVLVRLAAGGAADGGVWDIFRQSYAESNVGRLLAQVFSQQVGTWIKI